MAARPPIATDRSTVQTIACHVEEVVLGIDTHLETHTAVLVDLVGRHVDAQTFATTRRGHDALIEWARRRGSVRRAGVEGTGSYGVALARRLMLEGIEVFEVTRPKRRKARHRGKNDLQDALAAAISALADTRELAAPKTRDGIVEAIRVMRIARASAVKSRTQTILQLRNLILTAPEGLRDELRDLPVKQLIERCARWHRRSPDSALHATRQAMRSLARRHRQLDIEITELDADILRLTQQAAPRLLAQPGIGPETAARLLIVAGDNPQRLRSDAALAALCGASPVEASSGQTIRYRLSRGGDRQGNNALWTIANNRMIHHPETRDYVARRTAEGKTSKEIRRCLMRALARRLYPLLLADLNDAQTIPT
jgi:transposase